jgi:hypothetical protein
MTWFKVNYPSRYERAFGKNLANKLGLFAFILFLIGLIEVVIEAIFGSSLITTIIKNGLYGGIILFGMIILFNKILE